MTDFLGRVAARAVGASPAARPRLAGLFEPAGSGGEATLGVVEDEVVAPAPESRIETRAPVEHPVAEAQPEDAQSEQLLRRTSSPDTAAPSRPREPIDGAAQSNFLETPAAAIQAVTPVAEPLPAARVEQREPAPVVAAAPLAQALPAATTREAAPPPAPATARVEEPQVRVHIGRLEVRANVQPPPAPERPRREPTRDDGLSLADYLRGKREVRT